jgi:hypothetical protein
MRFILASYPLNRRRSFIFSRKASEGARTMWVARFGVKLRLTLIVFAVVLAGGLVADGWICGTLAAAVVSSVDPGSEGDGTTDDPGPPPGPAPQGYQWVLKPETTYTTVIEKDGYKLGEPQPLYVKKWQVVGYTEKQIPVYRTVTEQQGWEYDYVDVPVYRTVSYVKYYKRVAQFRNGVLAGFSYEPVYGTKQIQDGTRREIRRRPHWVTYQEFSHWSTVREPEYGWVTLQDGWTEPELIPNWVSRSVATVKYVWKLEPLPWQPGSVPDGLPEPDWLSEDSCPPWLDAAFWEKLSADDRAQILKEARSVWERILEDQISSDGPLDANMPKELFETLRLWEDFPREMWATAVGGVWVLDQPSDADGIPVGALGFRKINIEWTGRVFVAEEDGRLWYQVSYTSYGTTITGWVPGEDLAPYANSGRNQDEPVDPARETYGYGEGQEAWSNYLNPDSAAAQYLKLALVFAAMGDVNYALYTDENYNPHYNLCGELAVMESVGVSLEEGLKRFRDYVSPGILQNMEGQTSAYNLEAFFEAFDYDSDHVEDNEDGTSLKEQVLSGHSVIALVTIDNGQGNLDADGNTAHWVGVKDIKDGQVRIYNPFTNETETYAWEDFQSAWAETPGNNSEYLFIRAEKPTD